MNIFSWNIRGLIHPHKHDLLSNLIRDDKPYIFLVKETKMQKAKLIGSKFAYFKDVDVHCFDSDGASCGLATF